MTDMDIGWLRRTRTSDAGAAVLLGLATWLATHEAVGLRALAALLTLSGIALTLAYHDRCLERTGAQLELVEAWWLFRFWQRRRLPVSARGVRIGPSDTGVLDRGVAIVIEGDGSLTLERWKVSSQRIFAQSLAKRLARWLGVPLAGMEDVAGAFDDPATRMTALRAGLQKIDTVADPEADRFLGRRWWLEIFRAHCLVVVGVALLVVFIIQPAQLVLRAICLPVGILVLIEGFRGILPGKIISRLGQNGLIVERQGLSNELRVFVPYSDVSTVAFRDDAQWSGPLLLGFEDHVLEVGPRTVGLGQNEWLRFRAAFVRGLARWLDERLPRSAVADAAQAPPMEPRHVSYPDARYRPGSVLPLLSASFPRTASLIAVGFLGATLLLERTLGSRLGQVPAHVSFALPLMSSDLLLKLLAFLTCAIGAATLISAGVQIAWSAPEFRGQSVIWFLLLPVSLLPVMEAGLAGTRIIDALDVCGGEVMAPRFPVAREKTTIQYGPFLYTWRSSAKMRVPGGEFLETRDASDHVEVRGALGGHHLVVAAEYHRICDPWRSAVLR